MHTVCETQCRLLMAIAERWRFRGSSVIAKIPRTRPGTLNDDFSAALKMSVVTRWSRRKMSATFTCKRGRCQEVSCIGSAD